MTAPVYRGPAQFLHWLTAAAVIGLVSIGLWMTGLPISLLKLQVYAWHKWIGLAVLVLTALRLLWRWWRPPPPLPAMPLSGWLMSSAAGVSVAWFGLLPLPDLVPRDPDLFAALRTTHFVLSRLLIVLVALHVAAVFHHDVLHRDGIFRRMWPFGRS